MNKEEFLAKVRAGISSLPQAEIEKSLDYYSEMIDDCIEDGMSEEDAVSSIGTVEETVSQIFSEMPLQTLVGARVKPTHSLRAWEVVLIVLGSPVWLSLAIAAMAVFASFYIAIWSILFAFYCADFAFAVGGIAAVAGGIASASVALNIPSGLFLIGAGMLLIGASVLLFFALNKLAPLTIRLSQMFLRAVKSLFIKRGDNI